MTATESIFRHAKCGAKIERHYPTQATTAAYAYCPRCMYFPGIEELVAAPSQPSTKDETK